MPETYSNNYDKEFMEKYNYILSLFQETTKKFQETDKKFKETDKKFKETDKKIDRLLKSMEYLNNFTSNVSETIESLFFKALNKELEENEEITINGFKFYKVFKNAKIGIKKFQKEVDIILTNSNEKMLAIIEVKNKLHENDIAQLEKAKKFIQKDKEFKNYSVIFGFATVNVPDEIKQKILDNGFFIIEFDINSKAKHFCLPQKLQIYNSSKNNSFWKSIKSFLNL